METISELLNCLSARLGWIDTASTIIALAVTFASFWVGLLNPRNDGVGAKIIKILNFISIVNPKNVEVVPKETVDVAQTKNNV